MQRYNPRGLAVALTAIGLAACADPAPPSAPRSTASRASLATSGSVDGATICTPCPPGVICAAVCDTSAAIEVVLTGDTAGTDATVVLGPAATPRPPAAPSDTAQR